MIAWLMNARSDFKSHENFLMEADPRALLKWKRYGFWFVIPGASNNPFDRLGSSVTQDVKKQIYQHLDDVLTIVRGIEIGHEFPYQRMIDLLSIVRVLLPEVGKKQAKSGPNCE